MTYDEIIQWDDDQVLQDYLDGELSATNVLLLEKRLCLEDDLADRLIELASDDSVLAEWGAPEIFGKWNTSLKPFRFGIPSLKTFSFRKLSGTTILLAVMTLFWSSLIFLGTHFYLSKQNVQKASIAKIDSPPTKIKQQTITEGTVEFTLPTGVKVLIAAPATFQITGKNSITLSRGMLMAEVLTEEGKGFTVKTPSSTNIDLGTVFGVAVDQKGTSVTQVFQGLVTSTNRHYSVEDNFQDRVYKLTANGRLLHRTDGTSTQKIKNLAELFFAKFDHPTSSSNKTGMKYRIAKLIGIDENMAKNLRKKHQENPDSVTELASLEEDVLLANQTENEANSTTSFYNSFDNDLAIEMGGAVKNAKSGPQYANLTYEEGGVLIKEGARLSFATAGRLNRKKGHISFRIKPNWDGATDKQHRSFICSGAFWIGKYYVGTSGKKVSSLVFRLDNKEGVHIGTIPFQKKKWMIESWKKETWHTIEVEWDTTLPAGQQYLTLAVDGLFTRRVTGTWNSTQSITSTFAIGTGNDFQQSADAVFDEIQISSTPKGNKK